MVVVCSSNTRLGMGGEIRMEKWGGGGGGGGGGASFQTLTCLVIGLLGYCNISIILINYRVCY